MQNKNLPNVISIGYGRHLFVEDNQERKRMEMCAKEAGLLHMIVFTSKSDGLAKQETADGLVLHPTNSASKLTMMFDAFKVASSIIKSSPSLPIVTTQDPFETGLIGFFLKNKFGIHLTVQEHGDVFSAPHWRKESILNRMRYYLGKYVLRKADTVRVVSDRIIKSMIALGVDKNKITKLPVSIDISKFVHSSGNQQSIQIFDEKEFVFLTVGRFVAQKNLSLLINSFYEVYEQNKNVRLIIVGGGEEEKAIEKLIENKFNRATDSKYPVKILPWSDNVFGLMNTSDAYVLSSNYEGWARVLIEAMCSKLPAVTTDVGCVNEVFMDNQHGLVVPVGNQEELSKAMLKMSTNKDDYQKYKKELEAIDINTISGTNISNYGKAWVSALQA